ncbi:MAG: response regulator [Sphingomonas sp.]
MISIEPQSFPDDRPRLLLIEDDDTVRRSLQMLLQGQGFDVRSFASAAPALRDTPESARVLVADYRLPDGDGLVVVRRLRERGWAGRAILITGHGSPALTEAAHAAGFDVILDKPLRQHELLSAIAS